MPKILVLGDSTSSSLGGESKNWLRIISEKPIWSKGLQFIDTSAPGMTAGAAFVVLLEKLLKAPFSYNLVILSIGNCDRIDRPYLANKITAKKLIKIASYKFMKRKVRVEAKWPKLSLFEWVESDPPLHSQSVNEFARSLRLIKLVCKLFKIPIIVIVPRSNLHFAPATASNNSTFYSILSYKDFEIIGANSSVPDLASRGSIISNLELTDIAYSVDVENLAKFSSEKLLCAANNLAVQFARNGELTAAIDILEELENETYCRPEIISFNLAYLFRKKGLTSESDIYFEKARDLDLSSYRVNLTYSKCVQDVFQNHSGVKVISLLTKEYDLEFLDHCHLMHNGQEKLGNHVIRALSEYVPLGSENAILLVTPANPEILNGDTRTFNEIFGLSTPESHPSLDIPEGRTHALNLLPLSDQNNLLKTRYIELIESNIFYAMTQNQVAIDEILLSGAIEKERERIKSLFAQLSITETEFEPLKLPKDIYRTWLPKILENFEGQMQNFLNKGFDSSERLRSIMTWYFRESLFFGFNSSPDMLFERNQIRTWKEGLSIAFQLVESGDTASWTKVSGHFQFVLELESELLRLYSSTLGSTLEPATFVSMENVLQEKFKMKWDELNAQ